MTPPYRGHRYRSADGRLDLFARDYPGKGQPLLLMHGLTRNSADFEPLASHLAGAYRLIVPDQRGRGLSEHDHDAGNYRPDIYTEDMWALLDSLDIDRVCCIGTSMGGSIAMVMAAIRPERVPAMVLNDIGPELMMEGIDRIRSYVGSGAAMQSWDDAANRCAAINGVAFPDFGHDDWLAFAHRTCVEQPDGSIAFAYDPQISESMKGPMPSTVPPDVWPLWDRLSDIPVLVLRGAMSDLLSSETAAEMGRRHGPAFRQADIPDRGHAPMLDEPTAIDAIEAFLARYA